MPFCGRIFSSDVFSKLCRKCGGGLSFFASTPLSIFVNGNIAVQYFFTLTGFLVCRSVILKNSVTIDTLYKKIINRYIRLWVVAAAAILFTFITMVCKVQYHLMASEFTENSTFLLDYCNFKPTVFNLLLDIFVRPYLRNSIYVGPLWTIRYEFWGYIICNIVCICLYKLKWRRFLYILTAVFAVTQLDTNYLAFFIGVFVADLVFMNSADSTDLSKLYYKIINSKLFIIACGIIGIYFASCPMHFSTIYTVWGKIPFITTGMLRAAGIGMLLYFLINCDILKRFLSHRIFLWFGKISYSIYAFHWPIMLTLEAGLFIVLREYMSYNSAALTAFAITLPTIYLISYLSWRLLEKSNNLSADYLAEKMHTLTERISKKAHGLK